MTQLALTSVWTTQLLNTASNSICVIKMAHIVRHFFCLTFSRLLHPFRFIYRRIILYRQARRGASASRYHHRISCPPGQRAFKLRLINRFIPREFEEERKLKTAKFQQEVAESILAGIKAYFADGATLARRG